jgi:fatty acid CoA ligase FadD32
LEIIMHVPGNERPSGFEPITASLANHAEHDGPAFTFVDFGEDRNGIEWTIGWTELYQRARAVAARLAQVTSPGARVALVCPQNLDYVVGFFGALCAGMIAVPLYAPEVSAHGERLVGALADCDPEVWLTSSSAMADVRALQEGHPIPSPKQVIAVDTVRPELAAEYQPVPISPGQPAYLQYTSGSTRRPAGAVITHRAVAANVAQATAAYDADGSTTCVGWLPFFHDMGLIQLICLPTVLRCHSVFTTPFAFVRRPIRWLRMLGGHRNVLTAAPNFAFDLVAARLTEKDSAGVDLSGVSVAINGSEPVRASTIDRFLTVTRPLGFPATAMRPSYGLAEATVFVSTIPFGSPALTVTLDRGRLGAGTAVPVPFHDDRAVGLVSAGRPVGQALRIVDGDSGRMLPDDQVGEIWLHGPNVADGYWRQAERSAECFGARISNADAHTPADGWLRTGDLGVLHRDELFITGRLKDLIIVDGRNHYPQDVEATVEEAHPAIRRGHVAVFTVDRDGAEQLVVIAEHHLKALPEHRDPAEVAAAVRAAVSRHHDLGLADFVLAPPGSVLRTSSGKVARSANRGQYLKSPRTSGRES